MRKWKKLTRAVEKSETVSTTATVKNEFYKISDAGNKHSRAV